jgi:uncharacterized protein
MQFRILAKKLTGEEQVFTYDNQTNILKTDSGFVFEYPERQINTRVANVFSKDEPLKKSKQVRMIKIQLGLSCNYSCDYCSQKFVERPRETNAKDIDNFMAMLDNLEFSESKGLKIEFWGGEPFVYWKTMKPLAEALKARFADWKEPPKMSVITNGSLLTEDICAWIYSMGFSVAVSHDGPGQPARGPDPFDDPAKKEAVLDLYNMLKPKGRMSFNAMITATNSSRLKVFEWFKNFTGDDTVALGEGGFVDAYDADGAANLLQTKADHFAYRKQAFNDIYSTGGNIGFGGIIQKIDGFINAVLNHTPTTALGQKCGMDNDDVISFDLKGNVITCQNVSAIDTSKNGESHLGGNLTAVEDVCITTATHWSKRKECPSCPVLQVCQGSCMFLDGELWEQSCNTAYSDAVPLFALGFEKITQGYIPVMIKGEGLPPERQDIFGTLLTHEEVKKRKIIPIVEAPKTVVDGIEVYGKSQLVESTL